MNLKEFIIDFYQTLDREVMTDCAGNIGQKHKKQNNIIDHQRYILDKLEQSGGLLEEEVLGEIETDLKEVLSSALNMSIDSNFIKHSLRKIAELFDYSERKENRKESGLDNVIKFPKNVKK